jgi:arginine/lysine/ornithine decarboxylase
VDKVGRPTRIQEELISEMDNGIIAASCSYASRNPVRMHMPGHKGRRALPVSNTLVEGSSEWAGHMLDELRAIDMTEAPGLDNLHYPTGCIRESERRAEAVFGSARAHFLVNGATSGIQASLLAVRMTLGEGTIVLPRNVHKSLVSAMVMAGLEPVFAWPEYSTEFSVHMPLDWPRLKETLDDLDRQGHPAPKAVFVINPTYLGFARDVSEIAREVHARGMALVVDEAHGPHFAVGKGLPRPALRSGADLVIHGLHKTTPAYTQTALLHIGMGANRRFPGLCDAVEEALRAVQTTSPSYILMSSIEQAVGILARDGGRWVNKGTETALELARRLSSIPGLRVAGYGKDAAQSADIVHDPSKLMVILDGLSVTGPEAVRYLVRECNIVPEMTGPNYILMLVSGAHGQSDVAAIERAFRCLAERHPAPNGKMAAADGAGSDSALAALTKGMPRPSRTMSLRDAFLSVAKPLPVREAAGRISADTIVIYPPGSPLITPGERIDPEVVEYILSAREAGLNVLGRSIRGGEGEMRVYCVASS